VRLFLSERGRALEKTVAEEMAQLARRSLATLSEDEVKALVAALSAIRRNLQS
jgi:DNA-binding MarR family transcriptional regulator